MSELTEGPRLLLLGGGGGLLGRSVLAEFSEKGYRIRSVHRHPVDAERTSGIEWVRADLAEVTDWPMLLADVEVVINLTWLRTGGERPFRRLYAGLSRMLGAARRRPEIRILQVSVPTGPPKLEAHLPYFTYKRRFDADLAESGLSYAIARPTMVFAPGDKLLGVMMRLMARYRRFPMFGDGKYHLSPVAATDVAQLLSQLAADRWEGTVDVGGPERYEYRELTDRMFERLGLPAKYVRFSALSARLVAGLLEGVGSTLLYEYEVEWLMADLLGLPPCELLGGPLEPVEPYLERVAAQLETER